MSAVALITARSQESGGHLLPYFNVIYIAGEFTSSCSLIKRGIHQCGFTAGFARTRFGARVLSLVKGFSCTH